MMHSKIRRAMASKEEVLGFVGAAVQVIFSPIGIALSFNIQFIKKWLHIFCFLI